MIFTILDRYIGKIILHFTGVSLFILISLSSLIKFFDELRKLEQNDNSLVCSLIYIVFNIPKEIEIFFPMGVLLGTLLGLGLLLNRNELIIMESVGFGYLQIVGSIFKVAILMIILLFIISECISPISNRFIHNFRINRVCDNINYSIINNLWVKDKDDFIFIERVINKDKLFGVDIYQFDNKVTLKVIRHAKYAIFSDGIWKLFCVHELNFSDVHCLVNKNIASIIWQTTLTPDILFLTNKKINSFSISLLFDYIKYLDQSNQFSGYHKFYFWSKVFLPLSSFVMMIVGMLCILRIFCSVRISVRIFFGVVFGFLFYVLFKICCFLSISYNISPIIGVISPNIFFLVITLPFLFLRKCY